VFSRLIVLLILWALGTTAVSAQDQIVRIYGDTIQCYIEREDQQFLYYKPFDSKKAETEVISVKEVIDIIYDRSVTRIRKYDEKIESKKFRRFQISSVYGYSWTLSADDIYGEDFQLVYDELRGGPFLDLRLNCFLNEEVGLGLLYSNSQYENNEDVGVAVRFQDGTEVSGPLDHDRTIHYYALNLAFNHSSERNNFAFQIDIGLGLLTLEDRAAFINDYTLRSSGLGGHISARFSIDLGEGFYLPANVGLKGFNLRTFDITPSQEMAPDIIRVLDSIYETAQNGITMNRVEVGLGLGFSF
jgi:hypothetical protein